MRIYIYNIYIYSLYCCNVWCGAVCLPCDVRVSLYALCRLRMSAVQTCCWSWLSASARPTPSTWTPTQMQARRWMKTAQPTYSTSGMDFAYVCVNVTLVHSSKLVAIFLRKNTLSTPLFFYLASPSLSLSTAPLFFLHTLLHSFASSPSPSPPPSLSTHLQLCLQNSFPPSPVPWECRRRVVLEVLHPDPSTDPTWCPRSTYPLD